MRRPIRRDPCAGLRGAGDAAYSQPALKIFVLGAGLVGATVVEALRADHDLTVVDLNATKLKPLAQLYDVAVVRASAASGRELTAAGIGDAELVVACTSQDEANLVAGMIARKLAPQATTIVRTSGAEYAEIWREGRLDLDFVVSSERETARAVSQAIGMPFARYTDTFADGKVQIVEMDVGAGASADIVGRKLRDARLPADSRVAGIIREGRAVLPSGGAVIAPGDRLVAVGWPAEGTPDSRCAALPAAACSSCASTPVSSGARSPAATEPAWRAMPRDSVAHA
jgi:trk system potassium uptake protein